MSEERPPPSRNDLEARLRKARAGRAKGPGEAERRARGEGLSFALRLGVEIVAALAVGVGIGLLLDRWLGTSPWMLLLFFVLGAAAGIVNVFRVMSGYGYAAGYRKPEEQDNEARDRDTTLRDR